MSGKLEKGFVTNSGLVHGRVGIVTQRIVPSESIATLHYYYYRVSHQKQGHTCFRMGVHSTDSKKVPTVLPLTNHC